MEPWTRYDCYSGSFNDSPYCENAFFYGVKYKIWPIRTLILGSVTVFGVVAVAEVYYNSNDLLRHLAIFPSALLISTNIVIATYNKKVYDEG